MAVAASGNSINFWKQPWIPWMEYREFRELMQQLQTQRYTIRSLADVSVGNEWNAEMILQIFGQELGGRILHIPRIPRPFTDQVYWKNNQNGKFTVKSAYVVDQDWRFGPVRSIWKWIWNGKIHPRISIFLWRILNEAIPTRDRLPFVVNKDCSLCGMEGETALHLFRNCGFAKALWLGSLYPLRIDYIPGDSMASYLENLISILPNVNRDDFVNYFGCMCIEIWNQRNALCIRSVLAVPATALLNVGKALRDFKMLVDEPFEVTDELSSIPEGNYHQNLDYKFCKEKVLFVFFTDASWDKGEAGLAAIRINLLNGTWSVKARRSKAASVLEAEVRAIEMAMQWAIADGCQEVLILSDSKTAVIAFDSKVGCPDWKIANLFFSVFNLSRRLLVCKFIFINRSLNAEADGIAKKARFSSVYDVLYQGEGVPPVIPILFL
ncbi:uncharacterized protein LOC133036106 [Cannabis sativa]|uniref:uncharacterized protein LOC133036106 n=1 Tax=Cannabis sativa TaxID=3483 RepID=UPI0029CA1108|nr:uncharacterized protein LOC133036106 [Cannabis sativa]